MDHVKITADVEHYAKVRDALLELPGVTEVEGVYDSVECTFEFDLEDTTAVRQSSLLSLVQARIESTSA